MQRDPGFPKSEHDTVLGALRTERDMLAEEIKQLVSDENDMAILIESLQRSNEALERQVKEHGRRELHLQARIKAVTEETSELRIKLRDLDVLTTQSLRLEEQLANEQAKVQEGESRCLARLKETRLQVVQLALPLIAPPVCRIPIRLHVFSIPVSPPDRRRIQACGLSAVW